MARERKQTRDDDKSARSAYDKAMDLLARREHSRRELHDKLQRRGYAADEIEAALQRLGEKHYQDDERFGEMLVRSRIAHGYGPARIRAELRGHGLDDRMINAQLDAEEVDWTELAAAQLRRRRNARSTLDYAERARRAQFLLRRGFSAATVSAVTRADAEPGNDAND